MKQSTSYTDRIDRVTDYLREHIDESPSLDELASVACLSSFHFHRIFTAITGETVNAFTSRLKLEKAARLLRYSKDSATTIALDCGFSSSSTFSRSFRKHFGISPSEYRNGGEIENSKIRKDLFPFEEYLIPMSDDELQREFPVEIRRLPESRVFYIRVIGGYEGERVPDAYRRLLKWSKQEALFPAAKFFGMSLDDPSITPRDKYRYEACMTVPDEFKGDRPEDISEMTLPDGLYATTQVTGNIQRVATATHYLFTTWLIGSDYEPEHRPGIEVFRDSERLLDWENFDLELRIPVKPLRT